MLPLGALENADNPDLVTRQKITTTSCSFILNKLNFVGQGVQRTQNFQDLALGLNWKVNVVVNKNIKMKISTDQLY